MARLFRVLVGATCVVVLVAFGMALGAGVFGSLPFIEDVSAVTGTWDYFAYDDRAEFNDALSQIPSNCTVDFEIAIAGSEALFAAVHNCGI